jgi:predicted acylesterase/phospholipase RssA
MNSISFSSGGYNCVYHIGVVKYIFENPEIFNKTKYIGCSGGAGICALILCFESDPDRFNILNKIIDEVIQMKEKNIKFIDQLNYYSEILIKHITREKFDLYIKDSDRCNISISNPYAINWFKLSLKNEIITKFKTYEQFIDTLKASACIPILLDNQIRKIDGK